MELRAYWKIFKRRWLLALIPAAVVLVAGLATYRPPAPGYNVGVRFMVGQAPSTAARGSDEERLANWHASEYIAHGLNDWVRGGQFAELVSARLATQGLAVPPGAIQGSINADNTRSQLVLYMNHGDPALLEAMMQAAVAVLVEQNALGLPQLGGEPAVVNALDQPLVNRNPSGLRSQLDLPLRVVLALVAGLGLALLAEYLDPTVRDRAEVEALGLAVMGEVPGRAKAKHKQ
jgi:capsular polysaccharide biosynthesis protein